MVENHFYIMVLYYSVMNLFKFVIFPCGRMIPIILRLFQEHLHHEQLSPKVFGLTVLPWDATLSTISFNSFRKD